MTVEDADGDKVGTVRAVYQPVRTAPTTAPGASPAGDAYLKVHAGLPILGAVEQVVPGLELLGIAPVSLPATATVTSTTGQPLTSGLWQVPDHGHFAVYDEPGLAAAAPAFLQSALDELPGTIALP